MTKCLKSPSPARGRFCWPPICIAKPALYPIRPNPILASRSHFLFSLSRAIPGTNSLRNPERPGRSTSPPCSSSDSSSRITFDTATKKAHTRITETLIGTTIIAAIARVPLIKLVNAAKKMPKNTRIPMIPPARLQMKLAKAVFISDSTFYSAISSHPIQFQPTFSPPSPKAIPDRLSSLFD